MGLPECCCGEQNRPSVFERLGPAIHSTRWPVVGENSGLRLEFFCRLACRVPVNL
jgi:hypothetical protein